MKRVLVMCNNPTTDGGVKWDGHEIVAYVGVTPPVRTQAEHVARLTQLKASLLEEIAQLKQWETTAAEEDPEDAEEMEDILRTTKADLEETELLMTVPLPVEDLAKIYFVGINSVPKDLIVDVVLSQGCPLDSRWPASFTPGSVHADLLAAVDRHLRPGGEVYLGGDWPSYHKTIKDALSSVVEYSREENVGGVGDDYLAARDGGTTNVYSVLVRKAGGGRRRKTRRRHRRSKAPTRRR